MDFKNYKKIFSFILLITVIIFFIFSYKEFLLIKISNIIIHEDIISDRNIDAICVLGGGTVERAIKGLKLYNKYNPRFLIVTGDSQFWPDKNLNWADMASLFFEKRGVNKKNIVSLKSTSTNEDISAIIKFAEDKKINNLIIISSLFHTGRIKRLIDKKIKNKNLNIYVKASNNFQYNKYNWYKKEKGFLFFFNEILKHMFYYFKGYI